MDTRTRIIVAAGFAVAATGGFFTGQRSVQQQAVDVPLIVPAPPPSAAPTAANAPARITGKNPAQATIKVSSLREILQLQGDFAQTTALYLLASQLDAKGIERLLDEAVTLTSDSDRRGATGVLYTRLAELDPEAAIERIMQTDSLDFGSLQTVFQSWSRLDLQRALARAAALQDERGKTLALRAILYARSELPLAEREALARKYKVRLPTGGAGIADVRTPESAERSWRTAMALKDPMQRNGQLSQLAFLWAKKSPEAALRAIEELDEVQLRSQLLVQSATAWAEQMPQAALDWAMARKPSQERAQMLGGIMRVMLKQDPRSVLEQAQQLSRAERQQVVPQLMFQWARDDVQAAADWLATVKDPATRYTSLSAIANGYAQRSPDEALRWAATLPKSDAQTVIPNIIGQIAERDPARGVSLINSLPDATQRDNATMGLAQSWARRDPAAAANWVMRLPTTQNRGSLVQVVFSQWALYDAPAAVQQLNQMNDAAVRDSAAVALIGNDYLEPELALQLYDRIESDNLKRQAAAQLYYKYRETDPALAERFRGDANYTYGR